jgi:lathosterol oxidase
MFMLRFLFDQTAVNLCLIFLMENLLVTCVALGAGWLILKLNAKSIKPATTNEILICLLTNAVNTLVTYAGFSLWKHGYILFSFSINWRIISDFLLLFMLMDLAMYAFHYLIHHSSVYRIIHKFHHHYVDPIPIDLFVLHPIETVSFGGLWIMMISLINFNFIPFLFTLLST